uniref:Uncharacterized protein n=1 Tax=Anopheles dirus TaxID=7168 RepID=A0A182NJD3_9DIPT
MRSILLLCLLTVANCKPAAVYAPSLTYAVPLEVAVPTGIAAAPVLAYQEVMPQSPGINAVTEYQAVPYYRNPIPVVSGYVY